MHRLPFALIAALALLAPVSAQAGTASPAGRAADCNFDDAKTYDRFGDIHVFVKDSALFGCATDVGRAYRIGSRTAARRPIFGSGDWVGYAAKGKVRALNVSTGRTHSVGTSSAPTALVVNMDGTTAWIAAGVLRAKPAGAPARRLASGADPSFLGLELEGCAVTWKAGGAQRSSSIFCANP